MSNSEFIDYYELLEVSPNANTATIEKIFRYLASRFHPDVDPSGNRVRFNKLVAAYDTLKDAESRAAYDVDLNKYQQQKSDLVNEAKNTEADSVDRHRLLSLFYAQRKRNMKEPGIGTMKAGEILGCPMEVLEFHLWYFREKGWVQREESGLLSITALGVDEIEARSQRWASSDRMITDQTFNEASCSNAQISVSTSNPGNGQFELA